MRIVHVLPSANDAYQKSLHRPEQRALGSTVEQVWRQLLRRPERFTSLAVSLFLDAAITSADYVRRYADDVA